MYAEYCHLLKVDLINASTGDRESGQEYWLGWRSWKFTAYISKMERYGLQVTFLNSALCSCASCTGLNVDAMNWLLILLARNQTHQGALNGIKLRGINERVHANVEKRDEYDRVLLSRNVSSTSTLTSK